MKRFSPVISIPAHILCVLFLCAAPSDGAPTVSFSVPERLLIAQRPFSLELAISWEGDAEQYLVEPPRVNPPQGITLSGSSYSSGAKENSYVLRYRYTLCAASAGTYTLDPVEISFWERNAGDAQTARTDALTLTVRSRSEATFIKYRVPAAVLLLGISLFSGLFVVSKKKKKARGSGTPPDDSIAAVIARERDRCRAYRISGDWPAYIQQVLAVRSKLPSADEDATIGAELRRLADRVRYGGYRPSEDEINLIERQLDKACRSVFPGAEHKISR